jgi:hypothetical protein
MTQSHDNEPALSKSNADEPDFLDEMIEEFTRENPEFPKLLAAAEERRRLQAGLS